MALRCEECFKTKFLKSNKKPHQGRRYWRCKNCGHIQLGYKPQIQQEPRELYIDIETSPNLSLLYDLRVPSGYVNPEMILKDWFIISWSAEWMNCYGHKNYSMAVDPKDAKQWILSWINGTESNPDQKILKPLRDLMDEADLIWGHNYRRFDRKKINTRLIVNKIERPFDYKMVDTLAVAKGNFAFGSNRLDEINKRIGNNGKQDIGLDDYKAILRGDPKALKKVREYNIGDVKEGIAMVKQMREWVVPFPKLDRYVREG